MKRLMICFVLLSSLNSCKMTQPEYYDAGYFHSVPPRSEIYGFDEHPHDYRNPKHGHRPAVKKANSDSKVTQTQEQSRSS
ncbi:Uncharacterised protein [Legionella sainthelensi]|uniref:Uncharacterized protein n=1 Tax=Legionella sainthelensi TaxID=28087 RepID=A0A2H5FKK0_9GAMM|nr:hypothetical protein [Legionella sainthelensi]AUH72087.1 hypothetical protein CAB17_08450 [Legionella sainthelensi]VEB34215.1 Uncharacterised protein [Legionella sainthelensi]